MKLRISFKHLEHSPALDQRIKEKTEKLEKYFKGHTNFQWVCWVHEDKHYAEIKVHGPKFDFFAKASADNMYKALDLTVEKIERQLDKQKGMWKNKIHQDPYSSPKHLEIHQRILEEEDFFFKELEEKSA